MNDTPPPSHAPRRLSFWRRGDLFLWLTGASVALSLLLISGILVLVAVNGVQAFWARNLVELTLADGTHRIGELTGHEAVPDSDGFRIQLKRGNRDLYGADFEWIEEAQITDRSLPADAVTIERMEWGNFYGRVTELRDGETAIPLDASNFWLSVRPLLQEGKRLRRQQAALEAAIGDTNTRIEELRLKTARIRHRHGETPSALQKIAAVESAIAALQSRYEEQSATLDALLANAETKSVHCLTADGQELDLSVLQVVRLYRPNELGFFGKLGVFLDKAREFVVGKPREANTEGGIFPAIFGTMTMVLLMSVAVVPFGVLTAFYLREYAKQGILTRLVRIAVNNLAGVPSIVYGVFGLGFFIYTVGGGIDRFFFPERLPSPTYGTGGILWASLTLALLTVPVVIVATEEALSTVPRSWREASYALGATQFQTVYRVLLPAATPGILTGVILAMARGAGEVAPLMLTGAVKLAPTLPIDGHFPYFHVNRQFMHLGFHIFDVAFQSPNIEAAKPMVYATTFLLLVVVVVLNLSAMLLRNVLRKKYESARF